MLKIEKTVTPSPEQWEIIIEGCRNPKNSWHLMDSEFLYTDPYSGEPPYGYLIGDKDHTLMMNLAKGGPVHAKYRRTIPVWVTLTAPFYWWKEFDTYKIGTVANSCSTMHKIHAKEFTMDDFSCEHLDKEGKKLLHQDISYLNRNRDLFNETKDKQYWWNMIQRLGTNYNQTRMCFLNYEVLRNIYISRKDHKLDEWHTFCDWIAKDLPYSELIIREVNDDAC